MPIPFTCPHCGARKTLDDRYAGQTGPCAECGETVTVPGAPVTAPPPSRGAGILVAVFGAGAVLLVCGGVLAALLIPAMHSRPGGPSHRTQCANNLKQIALALHNYHDTYKTFPPAYIADEDGEPMHSWRVLILPFMEHAELYERYDFDEPWDGPNNNALAAEFPELPVFRCPRDSGALPDAPSYMVIVGREGIFEGEKANRMADIRDGTSNTILVVEVAGATSHWMAPVDLNAEAIHQPINAAGDGTGISSNHPGGANVAMADGSVRLLSDSLPLETLRQLFTKDGREVVMLP
jgi:prepilin-type processing-associated H-X9-DG protein